MEDNKNGILDLSYLSHVGDEETCWSASELQHPHKELISSIKVIIIEFVSTPALWGIFLVVFSITLRSEIKSKIKTKTICDLNNDDT